MKILYNSKFLQHNPDTYAEGRYRIEEFTSQTKEVESNGETYITLLHSESHLKLVHDACMNHQVLAEVYLSPESYHAACSAVVRPPGHHAKAERSGSFLFHTSAICLSMDRRIE